MTLLTGRIGHAASIVVALVLVLVAMSPCTLAAQAARDAAFVVAVPDVYPGDEGFGFILRSGDPSKQDVIIMKRETLDASVLSAAVALLRRLRSRSPVPPGATEVTTVQGYTRYGDRPPMVAAEVESALALLQAAPRVRIGNVGRGRWLELRPDGLK